MIFAGILIALALIGLITFSVRRNRRRYRSNTFLDLPKNEMRDLPLHRHGHTAAVTGDPGGLAGGGVAGGSGGDCGGGGGCA